MVDLSTNYLGLTLRSPIVASAGPLSKSVDSLRRMEDAGMGAAVLHSFFEEQLQVESQELDQVLNAGAESFAEALSYFPDMTDYNIGPDEYLNHIRRAKASVRIPIIASLNGVSLGGWVSFARLIEEAGADALEVNIYDIPTDPSITGAELEQGYCELIEEITSQLQIPLAVKIGPSFTSVVNIGHRLSKAGARGLVMFNRFYQPDFDLETLEVGPDLVLSSPSELLLRLHWTAILFGRVKADLAITGGVHTGLHVLKAMMAGARVAMTTSALLRRGIPHAAEMEQEVRSWMEEHEYESIRQMQGSMSYQSVSNASAYERGNYMRVLSAYSLGPRM